MNLISVMNLIEPLKPIVWPESQPKPILSSGFIGCVVTVLIIIFVLVMIPVIVILWKRATK